MWGHILVLSLLVSSTGIIGCAKRSPSTAAVSTTQSASAPVAAAEVPLIQTNPAPVAASSLAETPSTSPALSQPPLVLRSPTNASQPNAALVSPSDQAIRAAIIQQSLASYYGSCACPYNIDRGGRRCGARSAYSRPGGEAPLCFDSDVSDEMVSAYRARLTRS
jgi:hypothetical protein